MLGLLTLGKPVGAEDALPRGRTQASGVAFQSWSGEHALTIAPHRLELGLFGGAHYGLAKTEISLHPALFFALPHVEVKRRVDEAWRDRALSLRARASYPTPALGLLSREGAGGLLPKTSAPPKALILEGDALLTWIATEREGSGLLTVGLGFAWAVHGEFSNRELPLLDFPFLYQRFAALYAPIVPRFFLGLEGPLWRRRLFATSSARYYLMPGLPDVGTAAALEEHLGLEYRFSDRVAVALELKGSLARYAYGTRWHLLPYVDARVGF